jgi:quinol monooxygenase YgiN
MILVSGRFRLPVDRLADARPAMAQVIATSLAEAGCRDYAFAEDIAEPGLFRVHEAWDSLDDLKAHFATPHMQEWQATREALGFYDRDVTAYEVGEPTSL